MTVLPSRRSPLRVCALVASLAALVAAAAATAPARAAEPVDGEVKLENGEGFIRLAFRFAQPVPAAVKLAWPVLIISFQQPVAVAVDGLRAAAPQLIGAARRDPDGMAIRIALKQKVRINTIPAAERYYVDLLPEDWHGVLPGLPLEVVKELAERARAAEQALRRREAEARSEEHTSELQSHSDLHSFPTRRSSDLGLARRLARPAARGGQGACGARPRRGAGVAPARGRGTAQAAARARAGRHAADLQPLCVRSAGHRQRGTRARRGDLRAAVRPAHPMGSRRRARGAP